MRFRALNLGLRVLNSAAAGQQLARRVVAFQAVAVLLTAVACLMIGLHAALAVLFGGGALALASLVAARWAFGGGVTGAETALGRLLLGVVLKWLVVVAVLVGAVLQGLPPAMVLIGVIVALVAQVLAVASAKNGSSRNS